VRHAPIPLEIPVSPGPKAKLPCTRAATVQKLSAGTVLWCGKAHRRGPSRLCIAGDRGPMNREAGRNRHRIT
jgi:hypothetical protein